MTFILKMAMAAASVISLTACATSIQNRSPSDIAAKAYTAVDSYTGLQQTRLPAFSPFEWGQGVTGNAQLQTAEVFQGKSGGSWLDITLRYDTPTPDPAEMRVYNKAKWAGGEDVVIADFAAAVMSCGDRVTGYSNGGYGGYYGGVHGLRGYGHGRGRVASRGGSGHRLFNGPRGVDNSLRSAAAADTDSATANTSTGSRPANGRRRGAGREGGRSGRVGEPGTVAPRADERPITRPRSNREARRNNPVRENRTTRQTPKARTRTRTAPKRNTRPTKRSPIKGMHFEDPQSASVASQKIASANTRLGLSRGRSYGFASGYRSYNYGRFGGYGRAGGLYPAHDYVVSSSCERQERIRVFVPKERMAAAERYGLNLYFRSNSGDERPVIVSPNYVMGYQMATLHLGAPRPQAVLSSSGATLP